jgi:hypothetical protein
VAPQRFHYRVERDLSVPMRTDVKLVRFEQRHGHRGRDHGDGVVLFHRIFKSRLELDKLEAYAGRLRQVARHAEAGTFGCFVETQARDGEVTIALYERWFDGDRLHCEELASRRFDPDDDDALTSSAEFRGELEDWAEHQNDVREAAYLDAAIDDAASHERATEHVAAAKDLAAILARDPPRS